MSHVFKSLNGKKRRVRRRKRRGETSCEINDKYLLSTNSKALLGLWGVQLLIHLIRHVHSEGETLRHNTKKYLKAQKIPSISLSGH